MFFPLAGLDIDYAFTLETHALSLLVLHAPETTQTRRSDTPILRSRQYAPVQGPASTASTSPWLLQEQT